MKTQYEDKKTILLIEDDEINRGILYIEGFRLLLQPFWIV